MSASARPKRLYWIGERDRDGLPLEYFGAMPGVRDPIPAMDLDEAEVAALTEEQWACIESPTGKRLYSAKASGSNTPNPPAGTSAPIADD